MSEGSGFGGSRGTGQVFGGSTGSAPGTSQAAGGASFPLNQGRGTSIGPPTTTDIHGAQTYGLQQHLYGYQGEVPAQYGPQSAIYVDSNFQNTAFSRGYGPVSVQAPAAGPGGGGGSVQGLAGTAPGETCLSTCTEEYTPYECSTSICAAQQPK